MKKKGFTLIELIVVIAIIGVLAAILVPAMLGYVKKSKITTCNTTAKSIYNAFNTALVDLDTSGKTADKAAAQALVESTYFTDIKSKQLQAENNGGWDVTLTGSACTAAAAKQGAYVGCYPDPVDVAAYDGGINTLSAALGRAQAAAPSAGGAQTPAGGGD